MGLELAGKMKANVQTDQADMIQIILLKGGFGPLKKLNEPAGTMKKIKQADWQDITNLKGSYKDNKT